jgi:hypothetical protein
LSKGVRATGLLQTGVGDAVLRVAAKEIEEAEAPISPSHLGDLVTRARTLYKQLAEANQKSQIQKQQTPEDVSNLIAELKSFDHQASPWMATGMPRDLYAICLDPIFFRLSQLTLTHDLKVAQWLESALPDRSTLDSLFESIHEDFR